MFPLACSYARALLAPTVLMCALCHSGHSLAAAEQTGPAAIYAGPFAVTPTLGTEVKYRDNIYLQDDFETSSWIYLLRPAVTARVQDRANIYQLEYKGEAAWYEENSSNDKNDYFDNTFRATAHVLPAERWILDGYVSLAMLHEDRGTGLTEGAVGNFISEPVEYDQFDVGGSAEYGSGIGRLKLSAGLMNREYQNFENFTRSRDRDETTLGATFFYPIAPRTDLLLDYSYKDIEYPNPFENVPPLDSQENALQAGVQWEITPNLKSTAKAGYVDKSFDDSARRDWDGLGWSLDLWMQPRPQDTISVTGKRAPEETTLQGDFIKRETLTASWKHDWSDRVYTRLSGTAGRDTYEQSLNDREDDIYNVKIKAGYEFRRWALVYTGYSWDDKDSSTNGLSYTDHTFIVGVDFSL
jgi:polysaccharide biosynthesis protein VpsM